MTTAHTNITRDLKSTIHTSGWQNNSSSRSRARMLKSTLLVRGASRSCCEQRIRIHCGIRDTVSAVGTGRGHRALPGTIQGMTHVCYFRHALALDERRVMFQPEYAWGGTTTPPVGPAGPPSGTSHGTHPPVLEVWFPGTHSDV